MTTLNLVLLKIMVVSLIKLTSGYYDVIIISGWYGIKYIGRLLLLRSCRTDEYWQN